VSVGAVSWRRPRIRIGLALLVALAGCASSPTARQFTLAARPGAQSERYSGNIAVRAVNLPKYLDRPQLVRYSDAYELSMSEFERWGEPTGDMVTRVLIRDVAVRLPRSQVFAASGPLTGPVDATLEVNIAHFEAEPAGPVVLSAQWLFQREGKKGRLRSADIRVQANANGPTDLAAAMSDALAQLSDRITASPPD